MPTRCKISLWYNGIRRTAKPEQLLSFWPNLGSLLELLFQNMGFSFGSKLPSENVLDCHNQIVGDIELLNHGQPLGRLGLGVILRTI
jgi:hypothetical protein